MHRLEWCCDASCRGQASVSQAGSSMQAGSQSMAAAQWMQWLQLEEDPCPARPWPVPCPTLGHRHFAALRTTSTVPHSTEAFSPPALRFPLPSTGPALFMALLSPSPPTPALLLSSPIILPPTHSPPP